MPFKDQRQYHDEYSYSGYVINKMEDRVRSIGSLNDHEYLATARERVRHWSFVPAVVPGRMGMIPFEPIYCQNDEDPTSLEPFDIGSHVSIYYSLDSRRGLEKPTCLDRNVALEWLNSRPVDQEIVPFPIIDQFVFYVEKGHVISQMRSRAIGFRPLFIENRRVVNSVEPVHRFIPFIPPNYPRNPNVESNEYPYDTITVRSQRAPFYTMAIKRNILVNRIHRQYESFEDGGTTPISIEDLNDAYIRVNHASHGITTLNSLDVISDPRHRMFKIHMWLGTIVRL
jgi:hypothetical protein